MKIVVILLSFFIILTKCTIEPHTGLDFPENVRQCQRTVGGYLWQWIDLPKYGYNGNTTLCGLAIYHCKPDTLVESYYMVKPSDGWHAIFEALAEKTILSWKYPDGTSYFTPEEEVWMRDIGILLRRTILHGTEILFHFKNGELELYIQHKKQKIRHHAVYTLPIVEFKKVVNMIYSRAFSRTI